MKYNLLGIVLSGSCTHLVKDHTFFLPFSWMNEDFIYETQVIHELSFCSNHKPTTHAFVCFYYEVSQKKLLCAKRDLHEYNMVS